MEAGPEPLGTSMTNPDFAKVAEAIGRARLRLEKPADVRVTLEQFLAMPGITQHAMRGQCDPLVAM
jgi:thiamine pyrophosphate-dependent acetolactate synthase large subunit-like protein